MATETSSMRRSTGRAMRWGAFAVLSAVGLALDATTASAQRRPPRRQATIEIRGTVPTPQVVTVRPREVPAYSRQVLVPRFYDHDFWPEIQEGYAIMSNRMMTPADSLVLAADSVGTPDLFRLPSVSPLTPLRAQFGYLHRQYEWCAPHWWCPPGGIVNTPASTTPGTTTTPTTPADTTRRPPPTPPDSTRRPPGTSSASRH